MGGFEAILLLACFIAAVWDFLYWEIPNEIILFLIALYILKLALVGGFAHALTPLLFALGTLVVGFVLFYFKALGPGDSKLIAVCALWFAPHLYWEFLLAMACVGGLLALAYHLAYVYINALRAWVAQALTNILVHIPFVGVKEVPAPPMREQAMIPYGIAIFCGALAVHFIET
ncbi:MAG: prepilin peptidase [Proteobacteria bacterium]|nr:prepilin peptidase [Pseudomonadota bacterium]